MTLWLRLQRTPQCRSWLKVELQLLKVKLFFSLSPGRRFDVKCCCFSTALSYRKTIFVAAAAAVVVVVVVVVEG